MITDASKEIAELALRAFETDDAEAAFDIEPLEELMDILKEKLRSGHIARLQLGDCSIGAGFIWSDLLTNLERVSDHCSNIGGCILETAHHALNLHKGLHTLRTESEKFKEKFAQYSEKYAIR